MIWLRVKWNDLLVLLGLRVEADWYLARAIIARHGEKECKYLFDLAVLLMDRHGRSPRSRPAVVAATRPGTHQAS